MGDDIISNLPENVIHEIMSRLPLEEAVRMSLLSSDWRYKWATLPLIVFERSFPYTSPTIRESELVRIVDRVLLLHFGPIRKFEINSRVHISPGDIDRWTLHLTRRSVKEFIVDVPSVYGRTIHSSLFSCQSLTHLELNSCVLTPPAGFRGFANLETLSLWNVRISRDKCRDLISGCPLLQNLTLWVHNSDREAVVNAPNLRFLEFLGRFATVTLVNTARLEAVDVHSIGLENPMELLGYLANLRDLRSLSVMGDFVKRLCRGGGFPRDLPKLFASLRDIYICVNFTNLGEVLIVDYFLQNSPNLQGLKIQSSSSSSEDEERNNFFWEAVNRNSSFTKLRRVKIRCITDRQYEEDLMKYVLLTTPVLEKMTVVPDSTVEKSELENELLSFERASPQARIVVTYRDE